jgi:hypothetical protein
VKARNTELEGAVAAFKAGGDVAVRLADTGMKAWARASGFVDLARV